MIIIVGFLVSTNSCKCYLMKTDLAHHDPFTTALRSLGRISFAKESGKKIYTAVLVFQRFHYIFF